MQKVDILRAAVCVAGLDGEISEDELVLLRKIKEVAGVGEASFKAMMDMAVEERTTHYQKQLDFLSADPEKVTRILLEIARADGDFDQNERVVLHHFAMKIGVSEERYAEIVEAG